MGRRTFKKEFLLNDLNLDTLMGVGDKYIEEKLPDNQLKISSGKIITFNDQQYEAINSIRKWLKSDKKYLVLTGPAGTGKSTIIKKILDEYYYGVVVSAPTHRAKKVIANTTGKESKTLHSLLGLRMDVSIEDFSPNNPIFNPIAEPQITRYNFCIVDEASMINQGLLDLIKEKNKNSKTKILFIGDIFQIPPVKEKRSEVFFDDEIEKVELTKVERQIDGNPLLFLYDDIRNCIDINDGFSRKTLINGKGEGIVFTVNRDEFRKAMFEKYHSEEFKNNNDYVKTIAWRNETVMKSNKIIRTELFGTNVDIVEKNDLLTGYRTVTNAKLTYNIIENSADYRIVEKSELNENNYGIKGFQIKLKENLEGGRFKYDDVFIIDSSDHNNLHLYGQIHDSLVDIANNNKKLWTKYYDFRRNNLLLCDIDKYINGAYRDKTKIIKRDLDYGFCSTIHKVQGGNFNFVFVLETDIILNRILRERNQIFYVAISRPTTLAYVLTTKIDL